VSRTHPGIDDVFLLELIEVYGVLFFQDYAFNVLHLPHTLTEVLSLSGSAVIAGVLVQ
jgi:hypothetical protein